MNDLKYFDIRKVRIDKHPPQKTLRHRVGQRIGHQKKILKIRWEFLDLNFKGILIYGSIIIAALGSAVITTRLISAQINKKPTLQKAPTFSQFEVVPKAPPQSTENTDEPSIPSTNLDLPALNEIQQQLENEAMPTNTSTVDKTTLMIRVLNGNGKTGDAAKTKTELESKGYQVGTIGNATYKYSKTQIYYTAGKKEVAHEIASVLGKDANIKEASQSLIGTNYQILIVLGAN